MPGQMNPATARVVDPIITAVARGYESQDAAIANVLFPTVTVTQRAGRLIVFGKEDFDVVSSQRAPGASTKRVSFGYGDTNYNLADYSLEAVIPRELIEEASNGPGIDLVAMHVRKVQNQMALEREVHAATLARTAGNYPTANKVALSGTDRWTDPASNPFVVIEAGKEAIRKATGKRPTVLELGPVVLSALRTHPIVLDKLSTATDRTPATLAQLSALFEVAMVVEGQAVKNNAAGTFDDVWGNDAILAYVTPKSMQEMGSQCFGYTYQLAGYPFAEEGYEDRNRKSWIVPYTDARKPYLVGANGGYLIQSAVA
jgi:hypothetical protein